MNVRSAEDAHWHISSLPVELLTLIFEVYLDKGPAFRDEFHGFITTLSRRSPVILSQVCHLWRAIALSTASLWTFICPSYESVPNIRRWVAICPQYPLDLQLARRCIEDVPKDYVSIIFDLFAREVYRWRSLSIELDSNMAKGLVKLLQSGDTPSKLEDLKVDAFHRNHDRVPGPVLDALIALLPRLKALRRLVWDDKHGGTLLHGIPWGQLKTVIIDAPSALEDIFSYLSQCTSAATVKINGETSSNPQKTRLPLHRFPAFTLPNLTVLKLSRGCDPMWLLRHFTMPSLQHMEVGILRRDQQVLEDFLKRSPSIRTLVIDERHGEDDAYVDEILISDHEILAYLTSPCLRAIPRVGIDLLYTKERILALIQQRLDAHRPLPPLLCWRPSLYQRLVGWWDKLDPKYDILLFSYKEGAVELSPEYEFDDSDCLP